MPDIQSMGLTCTLYTLKMQEVHSTGIRTYTLTAPFGTVTHQILVNDGTLDKIINSEGRGSIVGNGLRTTGED